MFAFADLNRDGFISAEEVLAVGGTQSDIQEMKLIDTNKDGKVSKAELTQYMKLPVHMANPAPFTFMGAKLSKKPLVSAFGQEDYIWY